MTCSICLESLKSPVSIPCGHIHCEQCLAQYIRQDADVFLTPDLAYVPEKLHEFMLPAVRRLHVDVGAAEKVNDSEAEQKAKKAEQRAKEAEQRAQDAEQRAKDAEQKLANHCHCGIWVSQGGTGTRFPTMSL
ncbi:hypothetical protein PLICRDRAFT_178257 [Plicaturopsis crispa FD-325 SS-3]|nr:hypothetical protein PLICRDRAFT_178257 [Plicaturopsis crispa FD-325 SS-3]